MVADMRTYLFTNHPKIRYPQRTMAIKKHYFFDMDHTVTPARQPILDDMRELLTRSGRDVVIVSGATIEQIGRQIGELPCYRLGQNGNHALTPQGDELWRFTLSDTHKTEILEHITLLTSSLDHELNQDWSPIEDRGGQITFSPLGNTAPYELKMAYDPDVTKRFKMLENHPFTSNELVVKIGGSTSFDYIHKDHHKGTNVARLIDQLGWNRDECVYYGDGLYPGGNDEAVIGVIDTIAVKDHLDTFERLKVAFA